MALTDENGGNFNVSMPVQPMGGGYGGYSYPMAYPVMPYSGGFGGGFGDNFGGDWYDVRRRLGRHGRLRRWLRQYV